MSGYVHNSEIERLRIKNAQLKAQINDLIYQLETAHRELDRLAPYAGIAAPPLSETQREVFKLKPITWDADDSESVDLLPPLSLR